MITIIAENLDKIRQPFSEKSGTVNWVSPINNGGLDFGYMVSDKDQADVIFIPGFKYGIEHDTDAILQSIFLGQVKYATLGRLRKKTYFLYGNNLDRKLKCHSKVEPGIAETKFETYEKP